MGTNTAMGMRPGPDKPFVKSIRRSKLTPVSHRITSVRLALPAALFLFVVNREVAMRRWGARPPHISLNSHQHPVSFHNKKVLRRSGEFYFHLGRIVRPICRYAIGPAAHMPGLATSKQQKRTASTQQE